MKLFGNTRNKKKKNRQEEPWQETDEYFPDMPQDDDVLTDEDEPDEGGETEVHRSARHAYQKKHKLTGLQRGLIILAAAVVFLVALVIIIWNAFATPPEIAPPVVAATPSASGGVQSVQVSAAPTVQPSIKVSTEVVTQPTDAVELESIAEALRVSGDRKEGWYTVLLVGTDYGEYLTDTMMLCAFDTVNHKLNIVSIPRDTFINSKDAGYKLNAAFTVGINKGGDMESGMESLMEQVSLLFGFMPDAYCMINLESFVEIIDVIGGVEFDVPQDMDYEDPYQDLYIHLKEGLQTLDGEHCMQLVRFRKGYAAQDLARVQVQQEFLKAVAKKMLSIGTVSKVTELASIVSENLFTNLTLGNIAWFGEELLQLNLDEISTMTLTGEAGGWHDVSYYFLYGYDAVDTSNQQFNPYEEDFTIDDLYVYTLENGVISRSLRSTQYNGHAYSNYGTSTAEASPEVEPSQVIHKPTAEHSSESESAETTDTSEPEDEPTTISG